MYSKKFANFLFVWRRARQRTRYRDGNTRRNARLRRCGCLRALGGMRLLAGCACRWRRRETYTAISAMAVRRPQRGRQPAVPSSGLRRADDLEAENSRLRKELTSAELDIESLRMATAYFEGGGRGEVHLDRRTSRPVQRKSALPVSGCVAQRPWPVVWSGAKSASPGQCRAGHRGRRHDAILNSSMYRLPLILTSSVAGNRCSMMSILSNHA